MDDTIRRRLYNACQPGDALAADDPRYVALDEPTDERPAVRGHNLGATLARQIIFSNEPVCELVTGLPGSGKSTELARLAVRLQSEGFLPVLIRGDQWLQTTAPLDIPDLWTVIVWQVEAAVLALEGEDPEKALHDGYITRFWSWLSRTEAGAPRFEMGVIDPAKTNLVLEFRDNPTLREQMRLRVRSRLPTFLDDARNELRGLDDRAKARGRERGVVVIFDSLERLRGTSSNWSEVLTSAEAIFAGGAPYVRLPVHAVYTVPPALVTLRTMRGLYFLPMIKLQHRTGGDWEPGFTAAREIIERRIPKNMLGELFGPTSADKRVRRLIEWSGGYPREMLRLLQQTLLEERIHDDVLTRIYNGLVGEYRLRIPTRAYDWLARVGVERFATIDDDEQRPMVESLILDNAVLRYANDEPWFDLHPAVRAIPGVQEAIARLKP